MLYLIIAFLLGILAGTFTGLIPGIHINLITIILLTLSTKFQITSPILLIIFITSMAITHTFLDFIPSIFLGAPDTDTILSILPGHNLLLKGQAYIAIILTLYGSLTALFIIFLFTPLFLYLLPSFYPYINYFMPLILIIISIFLIFSEKNKLLALIFFLLAGFLGIASLNLSINQPLLPLLTGLFGASNIFLSIHYKTKIPPQKTHPLKKIKINKKSLTKASVASIIASPFTAFLPGLGASQSALIGSKAIKLNQREFLFLLGAINTIVMGLSFITLYTIQKTRTGTAVAISQITNLTLSHLYIILITILFSGIISFLLAIQISKYVSNKIPKINYITASKLILILLTLIIFIFTDPTFQGKIIGLLIFITSASLGITTIKLGIRRMHLMGSLLLPTILFYLF